MFEKKRFQSKDEQAEHIYQCYRDIAFSGLFPADDTVDYPHKINKLRQLIVYAERELLDQVHSDNSWDPAKDERPSLKDNWLATFYCVLSKLYRKNGSMDKAEELLQHAKSLNDNIENFNVLYKQIRFYCLLCAALNFLRHSVFRILHSANKSLLFESPLNGLFVITSLLLKTRAVLSTLVEIRSTRLETGTTFSDPSSHHPSETTARSVRVSIGCGTRA